MRVIRIVVIEPIFQLSHRYQRDILSVMDFLEFAYGRKIDAFYNSEF
jgi:hypothetical protein